MVKTRTVMEGKFFGVGCGERATHNTPAGRVISGKKQVQSFIGSQLLKWMVRKTNSGYLNCLIKEEFFGYFK